MDDINLHQRAFLSNPSSLIRMLLKDGHTEASLALVAGVHQSTISRLLSGKIKNPKFGVVAKLLDHSSR